MGSSLPSFSTLAYVLLPSRLPSLTCRLGTLCIQGTASQHACGESKQYPSRPHDSDAHSWYRRTSHITPLVPHILHNEPPLQREEIDSTGQLQIPCQVHNRYSMNTE